MDSNGETKSYIEYADISVLLTSASVVKRALVDHLGNLWILIEKKIYKIELQGESIIKSIVLGILFSQTLSITSSSKMILSPFTLLNTYLKNFLKYVSNIFFHQFYLPNKLICKVFEYLFMKSYKMISES
jgi:hypothetical protein